MHVCTTYSPICTNTPNQQAKHDMHEQQQIKLLGIVHMVSGNRNDFPVSQLPFLLSYHVCKFKPPGSDSKHSYPSRVRSASYCFTLSGIETCSSGTRPDSSSMLLTNCSFRLNFVLMKGLVMITIVFNQNVGCTR